MTLEQAYLANHNREPVPDTKELAIAWLDHIVECKQKINAIVKEMDDLGVGKCKRLNLATDLYDKGYASFDVYEFEYSLALGYSFTDIHMYEGIEKLAEYLDVEMREFDRDCELYKWEYSFEYRNFKIYQIETERHKEWM